MLVSRRQTSSRLALWAVVAFAAALTAAPAEWLSEKLASDEIQTLRAEVVGPYTQWVHSGASGYLHLAPTGKYVRCRLGKWRPYDLESGSYEVLPGMIWLAPATAEWAEGRRPQPYSLGIVRKRDGIELELSEGAPRYAPAPRVYAPLYRATWALAGSNTPRDYNLSHSSMEELAAHWRARADFWTHSRIGETLVFEHPLTRPFGNRSELVLEAWPNLYRVPMRDGLELGWPGRDLERYPRVHEYPGHDARWPRWVFRGWWGF